MNEIEKMRSDLERLQQRIEARQATGISEDDPVIARMIGRKVELERALGVIEPMQAEVERLRTHNEELQRYNVAFAESELRLEQERDQLKATLQQFMALNQHDRDLPLELFAIQRSVSAKAVSLAVHDADVIERAINECAYKTLEGDIINVECIRDYANQLRHQAKEVQS